MKTFKERQIDLANKVYELHCETEVLLLDLIKQLKPNSLQGYVINDLCSIDEINIEDSSFSMEYQRNYIGHFENLTLFDQKELIDHILLNKLT